MDIYSKSSRLAATGIFQAKRDDSCIRVQQDFSVLPNPMLGDMQSSVAFNKNRTKIGLNVSSSGPDTAETLYISDTSLLPSCNWLGFDKSQLTCQLSRLHDDYIFAPVKCYLGTASINTEGASHLFQTSNSLTGLTDPGLLFIDNRVTFKPNSGHTRFGLASHYDISNSTETIGLEVGHTLVSGNTTKGLGVDKIDFLGQGSGQVKFIPIPRNLVALNLEIGGTKCWNKDSQTSVSIHTDIYNRCGVAKAKHIQRVMQFMDVHVAAELPMFDSESSKRVGVSIKPIFAK